LPRKNKLQRYLLTQPIGAFVAIASGRSITLYDLSAPTA
jgi:hypothetical protein